MGAVIDAEGLGMTVRVPGGRPLALLVDATFSVPEGSSAAIIGRSGSGKTTLLSLIGLMKQPSAGRLFVAGKDVTRMSASELASLRNSALGFVFQDYSLLAHLSVVENVMLPFLYGRPESRRGARRAASEALELVGLGGYERRRPRHLSGGEQQRVAIARALARSPRLVLADEPTGALDTSTGAQIMGVLKNAAGERNTTLVVVTHDRDVAGAVDRKWILDAGRLAPDPADPTVPS